jgi:hypothetical protein
LGGICLETGKLWLVEDDKMQASKRVEIDGTVFCALAYYRKGYVNVTKETQRGGGIVVLTDNIMMMPTLVLVSKYVLQPAIPHKDGELGDDIRNLGCLSLEEYWSDVISPSHW